MGDSRRVMAGEVEDRVVVGQRVIAGVIAERPLAAQLVDVDVAFQHEVGGGRHLEVDGLALDQLDRLAAQKPREQELVDAVRQRGGGGVRQHGIAAQRDGHRHPRLSQLLVAAHVAAPGLVQLPVHAGRARVVDLHAVAADVARPLVGIARDHHRQRDVGAAVAWPGREHRQLGQVRFGLDDLLAGAAAYDLGRGAGDARQLGQHADLVHQAGRRLRLHQSQDRARVLVEVSRPPAPRTSAGGSRRC